MNRGNDAGPLIGINVAQREPFLDGGMSDAFATRGLFRIPGDPNLVQVQFGPFSRPLTEEEYDASGHEPPLEELPWIGERADGSGEVES